MFIHKHHHVKLSVLIVLGFLSIGAYIIRIEHTCLIQSCTTSNPQQEKRVSKNDTYIHSTLSEEVYRTQDYIDAREAVERDVMRREEQERIDSLETQASRERATQKALELRQEIYYTE